MAGIYIHIPFCKQACSYCDFHFSTRLSSKDKVLEALKKEIKTRANYLNTQKIESIYFGGGTPSLLNQRELSSIFSELENNFSFVNSPEITLEANPDDLTSEKLIELKSTPINRLSIGVQSFFDEDLRFMNRAHSSEQAISAVKEAQDIGFTNISIDLIFGSQTTTNEMWQQNLATFFDLNVPHLSAYSLTVEEKTTLAHDIEKGNVSPIDEDKNYEHYLLLQEAIHKNGFEQYELSNYCKNENYSKHNTSYWVGKKYLGIGPSAHSFNGVSRQWNISNNSIYSKNIQQGISFFEKEDLTEVDRYHEYLITNLRTKWGIDINKITTSFSSNIVTHFNNKISSMDKTIIDLSKNNLSIKPSHLFQSDEVVRELMLNTI